MGKNLKAATLKSLHPYMSEESPMDVYRATQLCRETGPTALPRVDTSSLSLESRAVGSVLHRTVGSVAGYRSEVLSPLLLLQGRKVGGHSCCGGLPQVGTGERRAVLPTCLVLGQHILVSASRLSATGMPVSSQLAWDLGL